MVPYVAIVANTVDSGSNKSAVSMADEDLNKQESYRASPRSSQKARRDQTVHGKFKHVCQHATEEGSSDNRLFQFRVCLLYRRFLFGISAAQRFCACEMAVV
mmetsp:Transcript_13965/g.27771  ORF Transcript_13965/g.27771 Transcript_13965/m.27771 type:complete len:102 (-) Transcript_13965:57-362(-)